MTKPRQAHKDSPAIKKFLDSVKETTPVEEKERDEVSQILYDFFNEIRTNLGKDE